MRTKNRPIEVLAPAGSMECLKAAILNGADAVYLGGEMFGARAYAGNFNKEELLEAIDYVHLYGKKLFLTVNTLMKEEELPLLPGFLKPFYEQGLDAVIVQDLGAVSVIRKHFPKLEIHASTQMTITGVHGARIAKKMGAKRVILSIALITTVFVYVGVSGFVVLFVLAPIATIMMKQAGYPYRMIPGIIFIGATCSAMIPYAINITNIMPAQYLGTSMGSAPILGWVAFVVSFAVGYFYMVHAAKKAAIKEGTAIDESQPVKIQPTRDDLPSFWVALIPFILVVVLVLALSNLTDMNTNAIVVLSMFVGSVVIVLFCHKQVGSVAKILEKGVNNGIGATVMAAAILGFSGVLQSCPGFQSIINFVMGLKMNPYLTEFFGLNILAGILGSGTSSIAMFFEHLSDGLLAKGASAGALHRLAPACATGMNTLPNAGGMVAQLRWMKLSLAESYWYVFMTSVLAPMIGSLAAVIVAMIIY